MDGAVVNRQALEVTVFTSHLDLQEPTRSRTVPHWRVTMRIDITAANRPLAPMAISFSILGAA